MNEKNIESINIINKLQASGHEAYWVGGCVRDILLCKKPQDFDIVTSAKPNEIEKIIGDFNIISVGKKFGVMIAEKNKINYEIATFRSEAKYSDARHPDKVFWTSAKEDAMRRDFTINGLFLDPVNRDNINVSEFPGVRQIKKTDYGTIIDYTGGIKDLDEKTIRFIGSANERIDEDNLRILRAVRFKVVLGFKFNHETFLAIKQNSSKIKNVSMERIRDELNKIFVSSNREQGLRELDSTGLLKEVLPEISKLKGIPQPQEFHKEGDAFVHTCLALKSLPDNSPLTLVWATLLHDAGKAETITYPKEKNDRIRFNKHVKYSAGIASRICRRLKFPNFERELIVWLVKNHMMIGDIPKMRLSKQRIWLMDPRFPWLLALHKADALGSWPQDLALYKADLSLYNKVHKMHQEEKKRPKYKPILSGDEIIKEFKIEPGPKIGKLLEIIKEAQLEGKIKNKTEALDLVKKNI